MTTTITQMLDKMHSLMYDGGRLQQVVYDTIDSVSNGEIDIINVSNPVPLLIEMQAVETTMLLNRDRISDNQQYQNNATTFEDLYLHMADTDYLGVFSNPSSVPYTIYLRKDEILNRAVLIPGTSSRKILIPRYTIFKNGDTFFTTMYPIEIRVSASNGIRVVYDAEVPNPIQTLTTNVLDTMLSVLSEGDKEFLFITLPVLQLKRETHDATLDRSTGYVAKYNFTDKFYYCRVFGVDNLGNKVEYNSIHGEAINYDIRNPTAVFKVSGQVLSVEVPLIYFSENILQRRLSVEIYTTRGDVTIDYSDFSPNTFSVVWGGDYNDVNDSVYAAPLGAFRDWGIYSQGITSGGTNGLTFDELKDRVTSNATQIDIPISNPQLKAKFKTFGYDMIESVDNIGRLIYLATRSMPVIAGFNSGPSVCIDTMTVTLDELRSLSTVVDNEIRLTILPTTMFKFTEGLINPVSDSQRPEHIARNKEELMNILNQSKYVYTPFHYVLDRSSNFFDLRAYYLDNPIIKTRRFLAENDTMQLTVSTSQYNIERTASGYKLTIRSKAGDAYKALAHDTLHTQLKFRPRNEDNDVYINGRLILVDDTGYYWEFLLNTNYDLDRLNDITLTNFVMFNTNVQNFQSKLTEDFQLIYAVSEYSIPGYLRNELDDELHLPLLPFNTKAISMENINIQLGDSLDYLWSNGRPVPGTFEVKVHEEDVVYTYPSTVYKRDANGSIVTEIDPSTNRPVPVVEHRKGDVVMVDGEPKLRYRKGDPVLVNGETVLIQGRTTKYQLDILFTDGLYYYADTPADIRYKKSIPTTIVGFINNDLAHLNSLRLETANIFYYPKRTLGYSKVLVENADEITIDSALTFNLSFHLTDTNYRDELLKDDIKETASRVINNALIPDTFSIDNVISTLKTELGNSIISTFLDKIGPNNNITTFTSIDAAEKTSVKRVLVLLPNNQLRVQEDIPISWYRHTGG